MLIVRPKEEPKVIMTKLAVSQKKEKKINRTMNAYIKNI